MIRLTVCNSNFNIRAKVNVEELKPFLFLFFSLVSQNIHVYLYGTGTYNGNEEGSQTSVQKPIFHTYMRKGRKKRDDRNKKKTKSVFQTHSISFRSILGGSISFSVKKRQYVSDYVNDLGGLENCFCLATFFSSAISRWFPFSSPVGFFCDIKVKKRSRC